MVLFIFSAPILDSTGHDESPTLLARVGRRSFPPSKGDTYGEMSALTFLLAGPSTDDLKIAVLGLVKQKAVVLRCRA